jgi:predicted TPR repeat methyltransferase
MIRIRAVDLIVFPESISIAGTAHTVKDFRLHLYKAETKGLLQVGESDRKEIVVEPCDMLPTTGKLEAIVEVTDALDTRYRVPVLYDN